MQICGVKFQNFQKAITQHNHMIFFLNFTIYSIHCTLSAVKSSNPLTLILSEILRLQCLKYQTCSPKGNDRSPENKQVFLNSSLVSKRFFQLVKGSQLCSPWLTKF